jgi:predicted transposase/invertase (TIGR01784 family)
MKLNLLTVLSPETRRQARENIRQGLALDPLSDIVFKTLFAANNPDSREACRSLLSACTRRPVASISVKNNELLPNLLSGKTVRIDAHIDFNDGEKADLEIQMHKTSDDLKRRALVYGSKLLSAQPLRGKNDFKVKRVYQIFFFNFELFSGSGLIPRRYTMREEREQDELTNLLTVIFYELPKLEQTVRDCAAGKQDLQALPDELKWGIYLKYRNDQRKGGLIEELCQTEEGIMRAEKALRRLSLSEKLWWWKYGRDKRKADYASAMDAERDIGRAEGLEEAEAKYQPIVEEKDRQNEELRRKLREAGIDG